ncbi:unnamed protein product [Echinostoma caproni]|uniref:Uncharacterized protein n=1 Tax=Echinostoma caproni TaxID=27848 RepID=A0A3P8GKK6_9TREM|nr:unnamed protein product [Echinostoma caproni]
MTVKLTSKIFFNVFLINTNPRASSQAVEVDLLQDWIKSPRVVTIVHSADKRQSALFLCIGSQISKGVYLDLSASELIALDDVFRAERGPSTTVRITGRRLTKARHPHRTHKISLRVIRSNETEDSEQSHMVDRANGDKPNGRLEHNDSDEPTTPVRTQAKSV